MRRGDSDDEARYQAAVENFLDIFYIIGGLCLLVALVASIFTIPLYLLMR